MKILLRQNYTFSNTKSWNPNPLLTINILYHVVLYIRILAEIFKSTIVVILSISRNQNCNFVSCPYLVKSSFHHSLIHIYTSTHAKISPFCEISILFLSFLVLSHLSLVFDVKTKLTSFVHFPFNWLQHNNAEKWVGGNFINISLFYLFIKYWPIYFINYTIICKLVC